MFMYLFLFSIVSRLVSSQEIKEPFQLTAVNITGTSVTVLWTPDEENMAIISEYKLSYQNSSFEHNEYAAKSKKLLVLTNLRPYTKYEIWITSVTGDNKTLRSSDKITETTDILPPSAPIIKSVTKLSDDKILLEWTSPDVVYNTVDWYYVRFKSNKGFGTQQLFAQSGADQKFTLEDVRKDEQYCFTVEAMAKSIFHQGFYDSQNIFWGPKSDEKCTRTSNENLTLLKPAQTETFNSSSTSFGLHKYSMFIVILVFYLMRVQK